MKGMQNSRVYITRAGWGYLFCWQAKGRFGDTFARARLKILFPLLALTMAVALCPAARAQAPFVTDDTGVADFHKLHFEFNNEYDVLKHSDLPNLRQNTANFKVSYGVLKDVELGFDNQFLSISTASNPVYPDAVFGYGDLDLSVKWHISDEKGRMPGFGASLNIELPTGDEGKQLGSGVTDYFLNVIVQKSLPGHNTLRLNPGIYFAGNTLTGVVGVKATRGHVYTGAVSLVHDVSAKLDLGAEFVVAESSNTLLSRGQLQTQIGGNYKIREKLSIDFGFIAGFYQASPRVAPIIGFSKDF